MKRDIGLGDILVGLGALLVFVFIFISVIVADGTAWTIINSIVLMFLTLGAGALWAMNLMGKVEQKMLNVLYLFTGFIVLLHCSLFGIFPGSKCIISYVPGKPGMEFYVFVGALLVGAGDVHPAERHQGHQRQVVPLTHR